MLLRYSRRKTKNETHAYAVKQKSSRLKQFARTGKERKAKLSFKCDVTVNRVFNRPSKHVSRLRCLEGTDRISKKRRSSATGTGANRALSEKPVYTMPADIACFEKITSKILDEFVTTFQAFI